jgi:hypothetical protein
MFPRSHEKKTVRLCAWRFPYSCVLLRWGWGTLSRVALPPSLEPTLVHTNLPLPTLREPTLIHNPPPLTTFNRDKKPNYVKLTTTEIDSPPASQAAGQKRPGCDHPPKCTERMNDYYRWKFGDNMICLYYIPLLLVCFFSFFFFFFWGPFLWFFLPKICKEFFLYLQFL